MKPTTIRSIDRWIGIPATAFLSLFSGGISRREKPRKIVFLKFIEQGATVLAYPALKRATEMVGRENVYFCVFGNNRAILDILDIIPRENIITINEKSFTGFLLSAAGAIQKLRRLRVDTAIDMEFFSRASAIFAFLSGARIRVGLHRFNSEQPYRGNLMTHRVQHNPYLHTSAYYRLLVDAAEQDPASVPMLKIPVTKPADLPLFRPTEQEKKEMQDKIQNTFPGSSGPLILLNPNASDMLPLRKWETSRFTELGNKILRGIPGARIIITGAPEEKAAADKIAQEIGAGNTASFAGRTTLRELLVLYSMADVLVTNDSGPGHFSSLTPIRTIILFGPETPQLFGPLSPNAKVIWKALACSPCVSALNHRFSPCNDNVCMQQISVDEVYEAVQEAANAG